MNRLAIVTGPRDAGKTACARAATDILDALGQKPGGIFTPAAFRGGRKCLYFARSAASGRQKFLLRLGPSGPLQSKTGFAFANRILRRAINRPMVIVDEFGPLEVSGRGYMPALSRLAEGGGSALITVRPSLAENVRALFPRARTRIFTVKGDGPALADKVCKWLLS